MKTAVTRSLAAALFFAAPAAFGAAITIDNSGFESPDVTSGGNTWTNTLVDWTNDSASAPGNTFIEFIPGFSADGTQHIGMELNASVYQDLGTSFQPNTIYTLEVAVGNRNDQFSVAGNLSTYTIRDSADNILATGAADATVLTADGTFADAPPIQFITPATGGPTGPIRIRLSAEGASRSHFDNIRLDGTLIPEPGVVGLIATSGFGLLLLRRRRK